MFKALCALPLRFTPINSTFELNIEEALILRLDAVHCKTMENERNKKAAISEYLTSNYASSLLIIHFAFETPAVHSTHRKYESENAVCDRVKSELAPLTARTQERRTFESQFKFQK